jgi:DNA-directed RNA polymerase specialized sigma24 family protein
MSDAELFDAFYAGARDRLLAQAFALTGDLPASRGAVRDSFIAAWHRWPKVRRLDDPEAWVRPHVWTHAQRRHTARIWHRDRKLDPGLRATLDALAKLPVAGRKALLLTQLTTASRQEMAREVGLPLDEAERRLQTATTQFSLQREVPTTSVRPMLEALSEHCTDQRWPRAPIIRRAGAARRRTHALAGAALVTAALVGSGFLVTDVHGVHPTLATAGDRLADVPSGGVGQPSPSSSSRAVTPASLLTRAQLTRAVPGHHWRVTGTDPAQTATLPCQRRAFADPRAPSSLVRNFTASRGHGHGHGSASMAAVQTVEYSADPASATRGFETTTGWFAGCLVPQVQLLSVRDVKGLGDQAEQYTLRAWQHPAATMVLGVARTGQLTTVTLTRDGDTATPDLAGNLRLLVSAVDDLCSAQGGGACSQAPQPRFVPAPPAGRLPAMLSEFDLPPVSGIDQAWTGTTAQQALQNAAATGCDQSSFHGHGFTRDATRTFLIPGHHLGAAFGLTETVGRLPGAKAQAFVNGVRAKLASCPHRALGTKVLRLASGPTMTAWRVRTQVTDKQTVTFFMGITRSGGAVAQVGFVPDGTHTMTTPQFVALVKRAGERLSAMKG